jgi:tRNA G18 (ribose-2'-O)-methylase SpoU
MKVKNNKKIYAILDNVRSRENVGSMFRTADAAGINKLYLCGITPTPPHPKISKTALGAENSVQWEQHAKSWALIEKLKHAGTFIVAIEQHPAAKNLFKIAPRFPIAFVVGNEIQGLSRALLRRVHKIASIPMAGKKESLNVAVAFGIAAYRFIGKTKKHAL